MKLIEDKISADARKIIIVSSPDRYEELMRGINWKSLGIDYLQVGLMSLIPIYGPINVAKFWARVFKGEYASRIPYPVYQMEKAKELFSFPPQNPVVNTVYGMVDLVPDQYVQISEFHDYFRQMKHSSFVDLCANLGAKEVYLEYAEVNDKAFDFKSDIPIPTEVGMLNIGIAAGGKASSTSLGKLAFTFGDSNNNVRDFHSPWLNSEPTWQSMVDLRKNNELKSYSAEFNYQNDMGVNGELTAKLKDLGLSIGGSFKAFQGLKLKYNVIFW